MRLYQKDAYIKSFSATVLSCEKEKNGWEITLDQSAFYPEGGGQPCDFGTIATANVLSVYEKNDIVIHLCDSPLPVGETIHAEIDFARRFDFMQQHSGEHIVSGIAHSLFGCQNTGFHLGSDVMEVDFDVFLSEENILQIESLANEYIWQNKTQQTITPTAQQLSQIPYRSKKELSGQVRIVIFPDADSCACCGTHVAAAGEIGPIKILSHQKFRQGTRLQMVCGKRALSVLNTAWNENRKVSCLLSVKQHLTSSATEKVLQERAFLQEEIHTLESAQYEEIARKYQNAEKAIHFHCALPPAKLRHLADAITKQTSGAVFCFAGDNLTGYHYAIAKTDGDLSVIQKEFSAQFGAKGGGKPNFVQGTIHAEKDSIMQFIHQLNL